jgi:hypothetical protein
MIQLRKTSLFFFLFINCLFILKYGKQITNLYPLLVLCYIIAVLIAIVLATRLSAAILTDRQIGLLFWALCASFVILLLIVLDSVNPFQVNVDRWSAISYFLDSLLAGRFPYAAKSHLGNPISGLPGLFIIGLPFYLIGDVGLLQIFGFIVFSFLVYKYFSEDAPRFATVVLLGTAPIFLWEVAARSELFSNMVVLLLVFFYANSVKTQINYTKLVLCGIFTGIILSTRAIVILPLILYYLNYFRKQRTGYIFFFLFSTIISFLLTILPFFLWNPKLLMEHNPILKQSSYLSRPLMVVVVLAVLAMGIYMRSFDKFLLTAGVVMFGTIAVPFALSTLSIGWQSAVYGNGFDISYFQFAVPFLLLSMFESNKNSATMSVKYVPLEATCHHWFWFRT